MAKLMREPVKRNVIANYVGQGWQSLMALAFVPVYIKYLGIESYGLIGIFAVLQAWLALLDMGMKPSLAREMARFTAGAHTAQSIRDLLRTVELTAAAISAIVAFGIWIASGWLASHWVSSQHLTAHVIAQAFTVMGLVTALRFLQDVFVSCCVGLQRQVLQNAVSSIMATIRGLGAVAVLAWVSPTIEAFFLWQALISIASVIIFGVIVRRSLPRAPIPPRFSRAALLGIWRFAAGMMTITVLSLLLTQVDKVLLSRMLTLEAFGYYTLAGAVAAGLYSLTGPVTTAVYPRFTQLLVAENDIALRAVYHQAAQLVTVLTGSAAVFLIFFGDRVLWLWTGNGTLSQKVAPLLTMLVLGSFLNALMWVPYQMQLAHGWTSLTVKVNLVAVGVLVPAIVLTVPHYGAIGAACVWAILNVGYVLIEVPLMHRRILATEKWRWYIQDLTMPLAAGTAAALVCRRFMPRNVNRLGELSALVIAALLVLAVTALVAPSVRKQITRYIALHRLAMQSKSCTSV